MPYSRVLLSLLLAAGPAVAQPRPSPGDSVTVTGAKDRLTVRRFVETFTAPTRITGKIARWETGICPMAVGLRTEAVRFVIQRVRDVAAQVDAPVNGSENCRPNIQIVFTTTPQGLLDNIRKKHDAFLGYADTSAQRDKLAVFRGPIQAWYLTATQDLAGKTEIDSSRAAGAGSGIMVPCPSLFFPPYSPSGHCTGPLMEIRSIRPASAMLTTGSRALGDGLRSAFHNVIIVADPIKLLDHEMGTLADYIAMLALTQLSSLDVCQNLDSVTSLLTQGCSTSAQALTVNDMGYLRGLYHMNPERALSVQEDQIAWQIGQEIENAGK